jgi:hypothetical protein
VVVLSEAPLGCVLAPLSELAAAAYFGGGGEQVLMQVWALQAAVLWRPAVCHSCQKTHCVRRVTHMCY